VLLPRVVDGLTELEQSLTTGLLTELSAGFRDQKVNLTFPRFKITTQFNLRESLTSLGMPDAFNPGRADFTGLSNRRDLSITAVLHKAFVEVNEEGTEAAAATGIVMGVTSVAEPIPVPEFRADHPFVFFIQDNLTGSILFWGRLVNPVE
jgi:serpin B